MCRRPHERAQRGFIRPDRKRTAALLQGCGPEPHADRARHSRPGRTQREAGAHRTGQVEKSVGREVRETHEHAPAHIGLRAGLPLAPKHSTLHVIWFIAADLAMQCSLGSTVAVEGATFAWETGATLPAHRRGRRIGQLESGTHEAGGIGPMSGVARVYPAGLHGKVQAHRRSRMPTKETLHRFIARVESNAHVEAVQEFYAADCALRENQSEPRRGRSSPGSARFWVARWPSGRVASCPSSMRATTSRSAGSSSSIGPTAR